MDWSWTEDASNLAQAVAFTGAGAFFVVKAWRGWLTVDLSVAVECERQPSHAYPGQDDLVVTVLLTKGGRGSVRLRDLVIQVTAEGGDAQDLATDGITRAARGPDGELSRPLAPKGGKLPYLQLTPDESMTVAGYAWVPHGAVATVDAVVQSELVMGRARGQWRAQAVSLPTKQAGDVGER